jgi:hypothetical protein
MKPWRNDCLQGLMPGHSTLDDVLGAARETPAELHLRLFETVRKPTMSGFVEEPHEWTLSAPVLAERRFDTRTLVLLGTPTVMMADYDRIEVAGSVGQAWLAEQYDWWCREVDDSQPGYTFIRWAFALMLVRVSALDGVLAPA